MKILMKIRELVMDLRYRIMIQRYMDIKIVRIWDDDD
jgi:hypothetical protein